MGRNLQGNISTLRATKLTQLMGSASASQVDSVSKSQISALTFGHTPNQSLKKNTADEQFNTPSSAWILQDEVAPYSVINTNKQSGPFYTWILDDDLNVLDTLPAPFASMSGFAYVRTRLYGGKLYQFGSNSTTLRVSVYDIAARTYTNYEYAHGLSGTPGLAVFNWPIAGKYHLLLWSATALMVTFDLANKALIAASPSGSVSFNAVYGLHVKEDGSAMSVAAFSSANSYGVLKLTASQALWTESPYGSSGQTYYSRGGVYQRWDTPANLYVLKDCLTTNSGFASASTIYYNFVTHLQGGDTAVLGYEFVGTSDYTYPASISGVDPSRHNQSLIKVSYYGVSGLYAITRSGGALSFSYVTPLTINTPIPCQIPGGFVGIYFSGSNNGGYLSNVDMRSASNRYGAWTYHAAIAGVNNISYYSNDYGMAFVTRKGRLFAMGSGYGANNYYTYGVTTTIPTVALKPATNYSVAVIGGGGAAAATGHGTSSSFAGIAAAAGAQRTGGNAGATVYTSGPLRGTGGAGFYDEKYGAGEDSSSNAYGGGSGYIAQGTLTTTAAEVVPYVVGFGPQYGNQGAVVLQEA